MSDAVEFRTLSKNCYTPALCAEDEDRKKRLLAIAIELNGFAAEHARDHGAYLTTDDRESLDQKGSAYLTAEPRASSAKSDAFRTHPESQ